MTQNTPLSGGIYHACTNTHQYRSFVFLWAGVQPTLDPSAETKLISINPHTNLKCLASPIPKI